MDWKRVIQLFLLPTRALPLTAPMRASFEMPRQSGDGAGGERVYRQSTRDQNFILRMRYGVIQRGPIYHHWAA